MNTHALRVLEMPDVLAVVAGHASTAAGAARVRALVPTTDRAWIESEMARLTAMRSVIAGDDGFRPEPIPEMGDSLAKLKVEGTVWTAAELLAGCTLLRSSRRTHEELSSEARRSVATALLEPLVRRMVVARPQEAAIERAIDNEGAVKDEASSALRKIRRELRGAEAELVALLERHMARLDAHQRVPDMSVTVRNGRYVIPIRREARGAVGGIVHDESATKNTLFVEPPAAIEFGNRIRELEAEEAREVLRVLRELTDGVRPLREGMTAALEALIEIDALFARARFADAFQCEPVSIASPGEGFAVTQGRHPLLLARGGTVVPFDLTLGGAERTLLISGPNTGGKTVLLKAIGLIAAMTQCGVPAPVGPESRVAIFDDIFADIGDEQSIEASLSTFSAHLRNLGEILDRATADSLVLMDELGAGTDPSEGAALGGAILEELTQRRTLTVATTHLGALKQLSTENPAIVNASLQFDAVALAPTYRLIKGIPGRSYGLGIARRLKLPDHVLARAEERVPKQERDLAVLLAEIERREAELAEREQQAGLDRENLDARLESVESRERAMREAERTQEKRARQDARRFLLDARAEIEQTIKSLRQEESDHDASARDARRRVESLAQDQADALAAIAAEEVRESGVATAAPLAEGDMVEVDTLGGRVGRIVDLRGEEAIVAVGAMKLAVKIGSLRRSTRKDPTPEVVIPIRGDMPEVVAASEVDLRGMRADEIDAVLLPALDGAVRAELKQLRIIHGKGTGALRQRVAEMLKSDNRVREFRLGAWNEGGNGVTVAVLE
ncbi:MAG: endonuclease MutS2 [Gemmatimonadaceae bacterium]